MRPLAVLVAAAVVGFVPAGPAHAGVPEPDRDGDRRSDLIVLRVDEGPTWHWFSGRGYEVNDLLSEEIVPLFGDFDGNGTTDEAVWTPSIPASFYSYECRGANGERSVCAFAWGEQGDDPTVMGDYDGDGRDDFAVYRPGSPSVWFVRTWASGDIVIPWGEAGDVPAPADYDGDGRMDIAIRRTEPDGTTRFWIRGTSSGFRTVHWGDHDDFVIPGDFDGDGRDDVTVMRKVGDVLAWHILGTRSGYRLAAFGRASSDLATPGDYDGDGATDLAVWRDSSPGRYFFIYSSNGQFASFPYGEGGDYPVANIYVHWTGPGVPGPA